MTSAVDKAFQLFADDVIRALHTHLKPLFLQTQQQQTVGTATLVKLETPAKPESAAETLPTRPRPIKREQQQQQTTPPQKSSHHDTTNPSETSTDSKAKKVKLSPNAAPIATNVIRGVPLPPPPPPPPHTLPPSSAQHHSVVAPPIVKSSLPPPPPPSLQPQQHAQDPILSDIQQINKVTLQDLRKQHDLGKVLRIPNVPLSVQMGDLRKALRDTFTKHNDLMKEPRTVQYLPNKNKDENVKLAEIVFTSASAATAAFEHYATQGLTIDKTAITLFFRRPANYVPPSVLRDRGAPRCPVVLRNIGDLNYTLDDWKELLHHYGVIEAQWGEDRNSVVVSTLSRHHAILLVTAVDRESYPSNALSARGTKDVLIRAEIGESLVSF